MNIWFPLPGVRLDYLTIPGLYQDYTSAARDLLYKTKYNI